MRYLLAATMPLSYTEGGGSRDDRIGVKQEGNRGWDSPNLVTTFRENTNREGAIPTSHTSGPKVFQMKLDLPVGTVAGQAAIDKLKEVINKQKT